MTKENIKPLCEQVEGKQSVSIRILKSDALWLLDHRNSKQKGIADVIHKLIEESNPKDSL